MKRHTSLRRRLDRAAPPESPTRRLVREVAESLASWRDVEPIAATIEAHQEFRLVSRRRELADLVLDVLQEVLSIVCGGTDYLGCADGPELDDATTAFLDRVRAAVSATRSHRLQYQ